MIDKIICVVILVLPNLFKYLLGYSVCSKPFLNNGNYSFQEPYESKNDSLYIVKFQCHINYILNGKSHNQCSNGKWNYTFPSCQKKVLECAAPKVQKGWVECLTVGCNKFYVGTEAAIRCERGYTLLGSSRMHCQMETEKIPSWSSPVPKCVLIDKDYNDSDQEHQPFNLFYTENSSIMIIIIILSVLAGGLMLLMSIMLMNRLFQRRRLLRSQRSDNSFNQPPAFPETPIIDTERNAANFPVVRENSIEPSVRWNCFRTLTSRSSRYQHMDTQTTEAINNYEQEYNPVENFEIYNNTIYSDDQTSLIQPPCYEEAVKCSQYSIVASKALLDQQKLKRNHYKSKSNASSRSIDKESRQHSQRHNNTITLPNDDVANITQSINSIPNTSMQSNFSVFQNSDESKNYTQTNSTTQSNDIDNFSRRSTRVHCPRVTNNITSESNVSFRSGSIETMAISDGTSVTVHTLDSRGSNPSLGSMRPQTGSIGDPTNYVNNCPAQYRHPLALERPGTPFTETDFTASESRYSPPPSYECSLNNPMVIKGSRNNHSSTASPTTNSNVAVFVDNMACTDDTNDMSS